MTKNWSSKILQGTRKEKSRCEIGLEKFCRAFVRKKNEVISPLSPPLVKCSNLEFYNQLITLEE